MTSPLHKSLRKLALSQAVVARWRFAVTTILLCGLGAIFLAWPIFKMYAAQTDITGPPGSGTFGAAVTVLPNGNIVITDPNFSAAGVSNIGAVYLYNGATLAVISTLKGSRLNDQIGSGGITVLRNGNFVVSSPAWDNGVIADTGAVTFCSGTTGCNGVVSPANSLVGSTTLDFVGGNDVTALANGNYVVNSPVWNNGAAADVGAVTFCNGVSGCSGAITAANSLLGATQNDFVGANGSTALPNGNYVVSSVAWNNGATAQVGAITFCNGSSGCSGIVSSANSLIGSTANDFIGASGIVILSNSNYVVRSALWDNGVKTDAGAVTFCSGTTGCHGTVTTANSLAGSSANDLVGGNNVTILPNGNYVVSDPVWDNPAVVKTDVGAVTLCNGTTGCSGTISPVTSLVGSTTSDSVGASGITVLRNGNYVVRSAVWNNGALADVGAVTFCNGTSGCNGVVSPANSLFGANANDLVGGNVVKALTNGNFVVTTPLWDNGVIADVGAVTFCSGTSGCIGAVTAANSLTGSATNDFVGSRMTELTNGNYVVNSPVWDNGTMADAGAVTFCSGTTGCKGLVTATNSLVGMTANDLAGGSGIIALSNGNYVVSSVLWDNGATANVGAVTFCSGTSGCNGVINATNSLIGSTPDDFVGSSGLTALSNGNYLVRSGAWDNGATANVGAVTFCNGASGCHGTINAGNSLVGTTANDVVGSNGITVFPNGNYVVSNVVWNSSAMANVRAITFCNGTGGCSGTINSANSLIDQAINGVSGFAYDETRNRLLVRRTGSNLVSFLTANAPPAMTAESLLLTEGTSASNAQIATASDIEDAANTLQISLSSDGTNFANSASSNGVTVTLTDNHPYASGKVFANVGTICGVTTATFTLRVSDSSGSFVTTPFTVTITALPISACSPVPVDTGLSDQQAGAVLVFPYYISKVAQKKDTRLTLTNVGKQTAFVHLFFIDGTSCQQADYSICLTPNGSFSSKASEVDSETTGWLLAVAVDAQGRPAPYNGLLGNAFVQDGAYQDNYSATAFHALSAQPATSNGTTATLFFDGTNYDAVPCQFVTEIQSPLDASGQRLITVGLRGDLAKGELTGAAQQGTGFAYNAQERAASFSRLLTGSCFADATLTPINPRIPSTLGSLIGKGNSGHLRFSIDAGVGLLMTPTTAQWSGIRTLHQTSLTTSTITSPLIVPQC